MNIMVFDVPAESGGALAILKEYYNEAVRDTDKHKTWYFVVSVPQLTETENVRILSFPRVKKSWLHRLYFDIIVAPRLVAKYSTDQILSLQNVIVPRVKVPQTLYVHQPLPFIEKRFKLTENRLFWVYQNIIGRKIFNSIQKANQVIVQTNWMKNTCVEKVKIKPEKISVIPPRINIEIKRYFEPTEEHLNTFFYPASGLVYKNHKVIVDAALLLKELGVSEYKIIFTLTGDENKHIKGLYKRVKKKKIPVEFIGIITQEQVFDYYSRTVLIFPSYIETFGLPMLEARLHRTPVLASDMPFSHEILDGYEYGAFFQHNGFKELALLMKRTMASKNHDEIKENLMPYTSNSTLNHV